eukprot:6769919-Pyramimonas_sp.AAC.1
MNDDIMNTAYRGRQAPSIAVIEYRVIRRLMSEHTSLIKHKSTDRTQHNAADPSHIIGIRKIYTECMHDAHGEVARAH